MRLEEEGLSEGIQSKSCVVQKTRSHRTAWACQGSSGDNACGLPHALCRISQIASRESRTLRAYNQPRVGEAGDRAASSTRARSRARSSTRRSAHSRGYLRQAVVGGVVRGLCLCCAVFAGGVQRQPNEPEQALQ